MKSFWAGGRAASPLLVGVFPFGLIYGALALGAGLSPATAQMMSSIVFAGSAQFVAAQLVHESAPGLIIVLTIAVVNLRHMLYSASIAPYIEHLPMRWKTFLAYLLTDEAYATAIIHYEKEELTATSSLVLSRRWIGIVDDVAGQHCAGNLSWRGNSIFVAVGFRCAADVHCDGRARA